MKMDDEYWVRLAKERGVRLPHYATRLTTGGMEKWLRKLDKDLIWFRRWSGMKALKEFVVANPSCTLREWVGLILEDDDFGLSWAAFRRWEKGRDLAAVGIQIASTSPNPSLAPSGKPKRVKVGKPQEAK